MKRIVFKSWLAVILLCMTIGSAYGLEIQKIEINQALGVQKDNHLYFVAGKDTVVRAFLSEEATITADQTWAKVSKDGTQVIQLAPNPTISRSKLWIFYVRRCKIAATGQQALIHLR